MAQATQGPQINVSKIEAGGGIAGTIFTRASMLIFLIGIGQRVGRRPAGWWPKWSITRASCFREWASSSRT
jgi:hypothetical protein